MKLVSGLLSTLLLFVSKPGHAQVDEVVIWGDRVDTLLQAHGETAEQFTVRAMQRLRLFTKQTGFEASGNLCRSKDGRMGITLFTWKAHFSSPCLGGCPNETPLIGEFVHSHPEPGRYTMTAQDLINANHHRALFKFRKNKTIHVSKWSAQRFSEPDYDIGPGLLVAGDVVLRQNGRGTARVIMRLPALR